jgi:hypothetical protein
MGCGMNNSAPFEVGGAVSYLFKRNCAALSISNITQKFLDVFMQHFAQIIFPKIVHFYLLLFIKIFYIIQSRKGERVKTDK